MKDLNNEAFIYLFREAFTKCFGFALVYPLSETESKHFSNKILEETGLVIGAKSIKNYSIYVLNSIEAKPENPSVATLDTLARYVLNAPYTNELNRKNKEANYPYWFQYRQAFIPEKPEKAVTAMPAMTKPVINKKSLIHLTIIFLVITAVAVIILLITYVKPATDSQYFADDFHTLQQDSMARKGWFVQSKDAAWWQRRTELSKHLTLFTLHGDNWADSAHSPVIKNLMLRRINSDCFTAEVHLDKFIPVKKWQQAGILLMEDTGFFAKSVRLSLGYNDFFGGYNRPGEIIIQAISSGSNEASNPEEILHLPLFNLEPGKDTLINNNLQKSALRIEKTGSHFRFLYAAGSVENFAFKEALSKDIFIQPKYIGLFALQGFVSDTNYIPAHFKFFSIREDACK